MASLALKGCSSIEMQTVNIPRDLLASVYEVVLYRKKEQKYKSSTNKLGFSLGRGAERLLRTKIEGQYSIEGYIRRG